MQVVFKLVSLLVLISAINKFSDLVYMRRKMHVASCFIMLIAFTIFNSKYYYIALVVCFIITYLYSKYIYKLMQRAELAEVQKLKDEISYYKGMAGAFIVRYDDLKNKFNSEMNSRQTYNNALFALLDSLHFKYSNGELDSDLESVLDEIKSVLKKPVLLYPEKGFNMFNELHTEHDYAVAIKAIKCFRETYFFGDGFNTELEFYERMLEEAKGNVSDRVHKK